MYQWSDEHQMLQTAMRDFIAKELIPIKEDLEHGDRPPYDLLRKLYATFGMDEMARANFATRLAGEKEAAGTQPGRRRSGGGDPGYTLIPIIELCRHSPGLVTALGVGLARTFSFLVGIQTAWRERTGMQRVSPPADWYFLTRL